MRNRRIAVGLVLTAVLALSGAQPAFAGKPGGGSGGGEETTTLGVDVSWPQCGKRLPSGQAFAIVGVNGGLANEPNPCFESQLAWAKSSTTGVTAQPRVQLYVNTANPYGHPDMTSVWPTSNEYPEGVVVTNPYGDCAAEPAASHACAYMYGYQKAYDDANVWNGGFHNAGYDWWLDVETDGTWSSDKAANIAVLEGMMDYFRTIVKPDGSAAKVGIYSTPYMWETIIGPDAGRLEPLPTWLPGASSATNAAARCSQFAGGLTGSSTVVITQFVWKNLDYNHSCTG